MSMLVDFDKFGMAERPVLTLAYPHRGEIGQLGSYSEFAYDPVLQSYSTISFEYPYYAQNGKPSSFYEMLQDKMVIKAEGLGEFVIAGCTEENDGAKRYKQITANSAEYQLCKRKINLLNGTYNLKELLDKLFEPIPSWSTGYISAELSTKYRTFDVPDSTLYDFLVNEVAKTFECVFVFDTIERKINAYTIDELIKESDIYVGYGNFLKSEKIEEVSEDLTTVMSCYGGDGVNIASVNPTGTVSLYNFDHYLPMMSKDLQNALANWKKKYNEYTIPCKYEKDENNNDVYVEGTGGLYSNLLRQIKEKNNELVKLKGDLVDLDMRRKALEDVQAVKIAGGRVDEDFVNEIKFNESGDKVTNEEEISYKKIFDELNAVKEEMDALEVRIAVLEADIAKLKDDPDGIGMKQINEELAFKAGDIFTEENLEELDYFKFESTHQDDNYIVTDSMSVVEEQDMIQQFYDSCVELMKTVSQPTYNITADAVNFLFIEKLAPYINKIYNPKKPETLKQLLGVRFHLEVSEDNWIEPVLLKFHVNFDDPTDFSMEFSNKYRLNSAIWTYGDLMGESVSATGSMSFDYSSLKTWNTHRNELLDFANNSLDMTRNNLVNSTEDQTFLIDRTGLRGHSSSEGESTRKGIWLTADTMAFTDNNWQTVKTAIGLIPTPDGDAEYGVNTGVLIGNMILGNHLVISADSEDGTKTMRMDGNGLTVQSEYNLISINPTDGISIQNKDNKKVFYADDDGNIVLTGNITATGGTIAGFTISEENKNNKTVYTLSSDNGLIELSSDGTATIGDLTISNGKANFAGTIYADQVITTKGTPLENNYGYLNPSVIQGGSIDTDHIASSAITAGKIGSNEIKYSSSCVDRSSFDAEFNTIIASKGYINEAKVKDLIADSAQINWLQGEPTYQNGYYKVNVNGSLEASVSLISNTGLLSRGWLQVNGEAEFNGALEWTPGSTTYEFRVSGSAAIPAGGQAVYVVAV